MRFCQRPDLIAGIEPILFSGSTLSQPTDAPRAPRGILPRQAGRCDAALMSVAQWRCVAFQEIFYS